MMASWACKANIYFESKSLSAILSSSATGKRRLLAWSFQVRLPFTTDALEKNGDHSWKLPGFVYLVKSNGNSILQVHFLMCGQSCFEICCGWRILGIYLLIWIIKSVIQDWWMWNTWSQRIVSFREMLLSEVITSEGHNRPSGQEGLYQQAGNYGRDEAGSGAS